MKNSTIQQKCKKMFRHLSNEELINRINSLPDFQYDNESIELNRRIEASNGSLKVKMNGNVLEIIGKFFYLGENGEKVFFNDLSISGIYILKGFQDDADRGRVTVRVGSTLCPVCWEEDNSPVILEDMSDVIFNYETYLLGIRVPTICWHESKSQMLYFFDNQDNLILQKTVKEFDEIIN